VLSVVIQAGGLSKRMGQNKALMLFRGQPLISRVIQRITPLAGEILITTNQPEKLTFLGLPLFRDIIPGKGVLGGLLTSLQIASNPLVAVIACDLPFINPALIAYESNILFKNNQYDLVVPKTSKGFEPLHAVYRRNVCLPAVKDALLAGEMRMASWFHRVNMYVLSSDEIFNLDPFGYSFTNINTPEDLLFAEKIADKYESAIR
jgi:molybdopterin-guanine dinucleotide biosynthesis protein A